MLVRISCRRCRLGSLWTDDPACFLATVCHAPRQCQAELRKEEFASRRRRPKRSPHALAVTDEGRPETASAGSNVSG